MPKRARARTRTRSEAADSIRDNTDDELDISSGIESDPSVLDSEEENGDFEIDAIKRAEYRDSRPESENGWLGWHYIVMWAGYLKTGSELEVRLENFGDNGNILPDFWKTHKGAIRKGKQEPEGKLGQLHVPPDSLLKRWFADSKPKRSFEAFKRRESRPGAPVLKADSDYYIAKARTKRKVMRRAKSRSTKPATTSPDTSRAARTSTRDRQSTRSAKVPPADPPGVVHDIASSSTPPLIVGRSSSPSIPFVPSAKNPSVDPKGPISPSETFGSPQTGIFDIRAPVEAELGVSDEPAGSSPTDDLFGDYEEDEESTPLPARGIPGGGPVPPVAPASTMARPSQARPLPKEAPASGTAKPRLKQAGSAATGSASLPSRPSAKQRAGEPAGLGQGRPASAAQPGRPGPASTVIDTSRPKYVQPSRLKVMEAVADPAPVLPAWKRKLQAANAVLQPAAGELHVPLALRSAFDGQTPPTPGSANAQTGRSHIPPQIPRPNAHYVPRSKAGATAPITLPAAQVPTGPNSWSVPTPTTSHSPPAERSRPENLQFSQSPELPPHHLPAQSKILPDHHPQQDAYPSPSSPPHDESPFIPARGLGTPPPQSRIPSPIQSSSLEASLASQHDTIGACRITAAITPDKLEVVCDLRLLQGSPFEGSDDLSLNGFTGRPRSTHLFCETLDAFCLAKQIEHYGSEILEWGKVICGSEELRGEFNLFVAEAANPSPKALDMGMIALLVSLPLDWPTPTLPNPVDPELDIPPGISPAVTTGTIHLLSSYSLTKHLLAARRKSVQYPREILHAQPSDLSCAIRKGFHMAGAKEEDGDGVEIDLYVVENARLGTSSIPLASTGAIDRRMTILTVGPSLSLLPSQWKARHIWSRGGLVTFSPTFLLQCPDMLAKIMRLVRPTAGWAAYIIPSVLEWASDSWNRADRCPNPIKAFDSLTSTMFLDQDLAHLSGDAAAACGGLSVSIAPPSSLQRELCASWISWYQLVRAERNFDNLLRICRGVRPGHYATLLSSPTSDQHLELEEIERSQLEDMMGMRMRPDLAYRRHLYIGETALDEEAKRCLTGQGIEFVSPAMFEDIFAEGL